MHSNVSQGRPKRHSTINRKKNGKQINYQVIRILRLEFTFKLVSKSLMEKMWQVNDSIECRASGYNQLCNVFDFITVEHKNCEWQMPVCFNLCLVPLMDGLLIEANRC